jgi:hypothetical protein
MTKSSCPQESTTGWISRCYSQLFALRGFGDSSSRAAA